MFTSAAPLTMTAGQKAELEALARNGNSRQKVALRCRILLLSHQGIANHAIAQQLSISRPTVLALRAAFAKDGMTADDYAVLLPSIEAAQASKFTDGNERTSANPQQRNSSAIRPLPLRQWMLTAADFRHSTEAPKTVPSRSVYSD